METKVKTPHGVFLLILAVLILPLLCAARVLSVPGTGI